MAVELGIGAVETALVRDSLRRIADSAIFGGSRQLLSFLIFVAETTLEGRGITLKAYTIATLALGRRADFDPQRDAIVRTEARRLRLALERYYEGPGRLDPVRITLPLGGYAPRFSFGSAGAGLPGAGSSSVVVPRSAYLDFVATFLLRPPGHPAAPAPERSRAARRVAADRRPPPLPRASGSIG